MQNHSATKKNNTHTHPFNGPLSRTNQVSRYQKGSEKPIWILLKQETVSGSGIRWAICKSAPRSSQITMLVPHHSIFYRPGALHATQPTASKHWRQQQINIKSKFPDIQQKYNNIAQPIKHYSTIVNKFTDTLKSENEIFEISRTFQVTVSV